MRALSHVFAAIALLGCAPPSPPSTSLYAHPWPDERLRDDDGRPQMERFPTGTGTPLLPQSLEGLRDARGFGTASGIFFPMDRALDRAVIPTPEESLEPGSVIALIDVDRSSPDFGRRVAIDTRQQDDAGPFGGRHLLALLPYPGQPLAPETLYAAVVTDGARFADGSALLASTEPLPTDAHVEATHALETLGLPRQRIAALAVFRTDDPTRGMRDGVAWAVAHEVPTISTPQMIETHDTFCVFRAEVEMPVHQAGEPPYMSEGGWVWTEDGGLARVATMTSRVFVTVPRRDLDRYPSAVFIRTGGGGDRPLLDRGPRDATGHADPGTGPAVEMAKAGYVGLSVDGPLGGARNLAAWDEQQAIFNALNPIALRDNVRQSALELVLFARAIEPLRFDASACEGAAREVRLDPRPVLIGHSMGATIAPVAAAFEPRFRALILSGAGASWIRQVIHKQSPLPLRHWASVLAGYWPHRELDEHDPLLSLVQWAGEPADPMVYGRHLSDRDILVFQGVLDTYIPPPIANPFALSLGLDLAGAALDGPFTSRPLTRDMALVGGRHLPAGLRANQGARTRVTVQLAEDGLEDGHEVMFQRPGARAMLTRFLRDMSARSPR
ncbi:MAG TPA: hypothetical protein DEF51_42395 [Myxococcales bacterium]|nr:hypothetical protein [Myxococcales bacterium]